MIKSNILMTACAMALLAMTACSKSVEQELTAQQQQTAKAAEAVQSVKFDKNSEIDNIKHRLQLTSNPGQIGYALLMNQAGQPIMYTSVRGKITSGGKRLSNPTEWVIHDCGEYRCTGSEPGANDEGTFGQSGEYVFFWTVDGQYVQWNGSYLYSDKPFRTDVKPLVIQTVSGD